MYKRVSMFVLAAALVLFGMPRSGDAALLPPPVLTVIKHVINDNGGTAVASDFTMTINGAMTVPPGGNSFPGDEAGTTRVLLTDILTGNSPFSVTESGPTGYTTTFSGQCSGTINLGDGLTCTVTNDDIAPPPPPPPPPNPCPPPSPPPPHKW